MARVDYHGNAPFSVLEAGTTEDEVLVIEADETLFFQMVNRVAYRTKSPLKTVQQIIRSITDDVSLKLAELRRSKVMK